MTNRERHSTLIFDKTFIKNHFDYNVKADCTEDFKDLGDKDRLFKSLCCEFYTIIGK